MMKLLIQIMILKICVTSEEEAMKAVTIFQCVAYVIFHRKIVLSQEEHCVYQKNMFTDANYKINTDFDRGHLKRELS